MAVYMPAGRRRRRVAVVVAVGIVVGLALGFALGRSTASGVDDAVATAKDRAGDTVAALARLPIEYDQSATGSGGETTATLVDSVDAAKAQLSRAYDAAPWLGSAARQRTSASVDAVATAVRAHVPPGAFRTAIDRATHAVADTFAINAEPGAG